MRQRLRYVTILRLECGDAPAALDEHPEHGL
jgi:hypothetical protein